MTDHSKSRVFVSSRPTDHYPRVREITYVVMDLLGEQGFIADYDLKMGEKWSAQVRRTLHESYAMVVIIGQDWLRTADEYGRRKLDDPSDPIRLEIEHAFELGIHIIPILLDDLTMPPAKAFPDSLKGLTEIKYLRADDDDSWTHKLRGVLKGSKKGRRNDKLVRYDQDYQILNLELQNFKCFSHLLLEFGHSEILDGQWTCIAGINGSGKSTILQAISLLLMGPRQAAELGGRRLNSLRRAGANGKKAEAFVRATIRSFNKLLKVELVITDQGLEFSNDDYWLELQGSMFAGYGASRNVSSYQGRRENQFSASVDRFISLFDPMAPLNSAEIIFQGVNSESLETSNLEVDVFISLVKMIFPDEISVRDRTQAGHLVEFGTGSHFHDVSGLPDGYRSSVAWIADLAVSLAELNPSDSQIDISNISGIVLVDEIELHLHASLQRSIVTRLRKALPKIQWIVTTHSPLVVSSFDRSEVVPLDDDFETGVRPIDRQILGLTADEVYEYFFDTPPSSEAAEELIYSLSHTPTRLQELDSIIERGSEGITKKKLDDIQRRLGKIRRENN